MIPTRLLTHSVDLISNGELGYDTRYGDPFIGEVARTTVQGRMERIDSAEDEARPGVVLSKWRLFINDPLPDTIPGWSLTSIDQVEWAGITFEVEGTPNRLDSPRGLHHWEYMLKEVEV